MAANVLLAYMGSRWPGGVPVDGASVAGGPPAAPAEGSFISTPCRWE